MNIEIVKNRVFDRFSWIIKSGHVDNQSVFVVYHFTGSSLRFDYISNALNLAFAEANVLSRDHAGITYYVCRFDIQNGFIGSFVTYNEEKYEK